MKQVDGLKLSEAANWGGRVEKTWLASLVLLPYVSYAALLVMLGLLINAMVSRGGSILRLCASRGLGWLAAGLLLSATFALDRGEGFLQLVHFLPFFLFFGVLATVPGVVANPFARLESLARWLLLTSMPLTILAIAEFTLKFTGISSWAQSAFPAWLVTAIYEPDFGHRASSVFGHPNDLSAYIVMVFGLGLGVVIKGLNDDTLWYAEKTKGVAQLVALGLVAITIFCTGSRNGVLIALVLGAIALYNARHHRWVMFTGLAGLSGIVAAVLGLGIGGRSLSLALLTQDPRVGIWRLAIEMIGQRPWLGWGFSGLRQLYDPGSIPDYDVVFHAHNIWLFLASEAGIPITIGFCLIVGRLYTQGIRQFLALSTSAPQQRSASQKNSPERGQSAVLLGYLLAFASCLLFGLFDVTLFDARTNVLSWGLLSAIYMLSQAGSSSHKSRA